MNIMDMHVESYAPLSDGGHQTKKNNIILILIGCDETGSGDFGPLCNCCVLISMNVIMIG